MNKKSSWAIFTFLIIFSFATLAPEGFAAPAPACYLISNFAVPNYVNLTLNGTQFTLRLNYIGPNSAGITVNETSSFNLVVNKSQNIWQSANYLYSSELINVSWLPVEHTISLGFCSTPTSNVYIQTSSASTSYTTTSISSSISTTTIRASNSTSSTIPMVEAPSTPNYIAASIIAVAALILVIFLIRKAKTSHKL